MVNWTEEKIAELQAHLKSGTTYSKIAEALSKAWKVRVTKNMIVGAANRNGWSRKRVKKVVIKKPALVRKPVSEKKRVRFEPVVENVRGTCQYIEGEPADRNFCGAPAVRDTGIPHAAPVWCEKHLRVVYIPRGTRLRKTATRQGRFIIWRTEEA